MADIDISHYNSGTATVAANGTAVAGQGTLWLAAVRPGDLFGTHKGAGVRIVSVNSNTSLTLAYPWLGGAQAAAAYEIQRTPYELGYQKAFEDLIAGIATGNLPMFAALVAAANTLPYFDSGSSMALMEAGNVLSLAGLTLAANKLIKGSGAGALVTQDFAEWAQSMLGLAGAANKLPYLNAANTAALADLTTKGRAILARTNNAGVLEEIGAQAAGDYLTSSSNLNAGLLASGQAPNARIRNDLTPDKAFRRGNILGTVLQASGVPTGALIETGSNSGGRYERYASGLQICLRNWTRNTVAGDWTAFGGEVPMVSYKAPTWTFPVPFAEVPFADSQSDFWTLTRNSSVSSATQASFDYARENASIRAYRFNDIAVGKWFL